MTLGLVFLILTLATVALLLMPLLRGGTSAAARGDYDLAVTRDQLAEIGKDVANGALPPEDAEAARHEVERRLLAARNRVESATDKSSRRSRVAAAAFVALLLPLGSASLYAHLGSPELPGKPYASRLHDPDFILGKEAERLGGELAKTPDAQGFRKLGRIGAALGHYQDAVEAYRQSILMDGGDAETWSALGEALTDAQRGRVTKKAQIAFSQALRTDPEDARARFFLGMAAMQSGDPKGAVAVWRKLQKMATPGAPWLPLVRRQIAAAAEKGGFGADTIAAADPKLTPVPKAGLETDEARTGMPQGPEAEAIMKMNASDQNAMIRSMVDRLAARMKDNPNDIDGWRKLASAYRVLGDTAKADEADAKAKALEKRDK